MLFFTKYSDMQNCFQIKNSAIELDSISRRIRLYKYKCYRKLKAGEKWLEGTLNETITNNSLLKK